MTFPRPPLLVLAILAAIPFSLPGSRLHADSHVEGEKWIQLFNGKDLTGWTVKITGYPVGENFANTFRVEDGLLKVRYEGYDEFRQRFGHIFYEKPFGSYRLRAEYRFVGDQVKGGPGWATRNSGLMLHGQTPESMTVDQDFPASIEVQLLGGKGDGRKRTTANLCTPSTNVVLKGKLFRPHCTSSSSETYHGEQWVTAEVEILGDRVKHIVDGKVVLEYTQPQLDDRDAIAKKLIEKKGSKVLTSGTISLQSESHPCDFRKVELLELPEPGPWIDLLPGGELGKHWKTEGNWTVEDGVISLVPREGENGWSRFGSYLWLDGEYDDFEMEFDYRVEKRGNSGFYFNVGDRKSPVASGIEVQIYDSSSRGENHRLNDHDSGGIIPGIPPRANAVHPAGEWNHFLIQVIGQRLTVELNGVIVNEVDLGGHPRLKGRPSKGAIGFQDHALPLSLKNLRLRKL